MPDCWHSSASWRDHWAMLGLETLGNTEMQSSLSLFLLNLTHHHFPTIGPQMLVCLYVHILIIEDDIENGVHLFSLWNLGNWRTWVTGIAAGVLLYELWNSRKQAEEKERALNEHLFNLNDLITKQECEVILMKARVEKLESPRRIVTEKDKKTAKSTTAR